MKILTFINWAIQILRRPIKY